ncbi:IclR family transcriptional regulator [Paenibacillus nasutitermitis]|uniref:IclR family transcriptional regulator n=1 Tax=Paenibacillus nasutitermitis TaxID=1652958 RepID=A0A916ZE88_9BACL|nr:IclR family transcriptional regulator [Paenibacillus nasutitermitis]GGD89319.1 IclR family transcriptional regulator [Paenibacillus nasutitermitis]
MEQQSPKVKSADRVLDILELFTEEKDSYNLTEIAKILSMPPSSTYLLLQNMLSRGYLETDRTGKQFSIGYKLFEIRNQYMKSTSLTREFFRVAEKMVDDLNETIFLGIRSGDKVIYIAEKQNSQPLRFSSNVGSVLPLHGSASGKILISRISEEELHGIYPEERLLAFTNETISTLTLLKGELEKVREEEIAYNLGESVKGVHCIAGPVWDREGGIVASVSISIPSIRITDDLWENSHYWVKRAGREISNKVYLQNRED